MTMSKLVFEPPNSRNTFSWYEPSGICSTLTSTPVSFSNSLPNSAKPVAGSHWNHHTVIDFLAPASGLLELALELDAGLFSPPHEVKAARVTNAADSACWNFMGPIRGDGNSARSRGGRAHHHEQLLRGGLRERRVID